jgi:SSS family solute:Na+ symporter
VKTARRSFLHCLIGEFAIAVVLWLIGFALLGYFMKFPEQRADLSRSIVSQADKLFPHFIATVLPSGLRGIVLAALFAAAMSSLSSGISSLGTVLVVDFRSIFARGIADGELRMARRAKLVGLFVGILAIGLSYVIGYVPGRNLIDMTYRVSNFFVVPLFVVFAMAFFVSFSTPAGAWTAIAIGFLSGVLFSYWKQIVGSFWATEDFSIIMIMPLSMVLSLVGGILVSAMTAPLTNKSLAVESAT